MGQNRRVVKRGRGRPRVVPTRADRCRRRLRLAVLPPPDSWWSGSSVAFSASSRRAARPAVTTTELVSANPELTQSKWRAATAEPHTAARATSHLRCNNAAWCASVVAATKAAFLPTKCDRQLPSGLRAHHPASRSYCARSQPRQNTGLAALERANATGTWGAADSGCHNHLTADRSRHRAWDSGSGASDNNTAGVTGGSTGVGGTSGSSK